MLILAGVTRARPFAVDYNAKNGLGLSSAIVRVYYDSSALGDQREDLPDCGIKRANGCLSHKRFVSFSAWSIGKTFDLYALVARTGPTFQVLILALH